MSDHKISFSRPGLAGDELENIRRAVGLRHLAGDGAFTKQCHAWLEARTGAKRALLTHSCTAALEMSALLLDLEPGDEVIMPSYTFVSTANAFVLRGARPVFVDIRPDTANIDEGRIAEAITERTRAIVVVHYAGVGAEMDPILALGAARSLPVVEDAAQGLMASYRGRPLGGMGALGAVSFHETKNVISGEGGALLVNDARFVERAEIIREKGTNRSQFFRGQVDKYTWVDLGSSFLPSEVIGAFLAAQLAHADELTAKRLAIWARYHEAFAPLEDAGRVRRPIVPAHCAHNAHMYYLLLDDPEDRDRFIGRMRAAGILTVFHYVPLHSSPAGMKYGRAASALPVTDDLSARLVRLPMYAELSFADLELVIDAARRALA